MKFNEELAEINFQSDENGQNFYYNNRNDVKKCLNEFRILMDEFGDYMFNDNGKRFCDNRIDKATPYSTEQSY